MLYQLAGIYIFWGLPLRDPHMSQKDPEIYSANCTLQMNQVDTQMVQGDPKPSKRRPK